jgi:hypothetical protein
MAGMFPSPSQIELGPWAVAEGRQTFCQGEDVFSDWIEINGWMGKDAFLETVL